MSEIDLRATSLQGNVVAHGARESRASAAYITPMAATAVGRLPEGKDWLYEVKFDGYRALVIKQGEHIEIRSRHNKELTSTYPKIASAARGLDANQAVIDGEIVAVDMNGLPSFQALRHPNNYPDHKNVFYAFDLLHLNGEDLTGKPMHERRAGLVSVLKDSGLRFSRELPGSAAQVTRAVRNIGLAGVIAKRRSSRYVAGERTTDWVKLKLERT
jgi:bifunctional non-homologous end joining protein LigD